MIGKALDTGSFSNREGPVFVRMQEQMWVSEAGVDRASDIVPAEATALAVEGVNEVYVFFSAPEVAFS
jgi:hypothetical protein